MTYTAQPGTIPHRAIEHLKTLAPGTSLSTAELADALGIDRGTINPCMAIARKHGVVKVERRTVNGVSWVYWSIGAGPQPVTDDPDEVDLMPPQQRVVSVFPNHRPAREVAPEFKAALWTDGSLIVVGTTVRDDGAIILTPEQTQKLKRLIAWALVEA